MTDLFQKEADNIATSHSSTRRRGEEPMDVIDSYSVKPASKTPVRRSLALGNSTRSKPSPAQNSASLLKRRREDSNSSDDFQVTITPRLKRSRVDQAKDRNQRSRSNTPVKGSGKTPSKSVSKTPSKSSSETPVKQLSRTPSTRSSLTRTPSTRNSQSRPQTPSRTQTPSRSQVASRTQTPSRVQTPSRTPSRRGAPRVMETPTRKTPRRTGSTRIKPLDKEQEDSFKVKICDNTHC